MMCVMREYWRFRLTWVDTDAIRDGERYLFAYEPHSVLPYGMTLAFGALGDRHLEAAGPVAGEVWQCVSTVVLMQPVVKHFWWSLGLRGVGREQVRALLEGGGGARAGRVALCPGGVQECLHMERGREVLFLRKRHGFIKLAIQTGAKVVPCFGFGQRELLHFVRPLDWVLPGTAVAWLSRRLGFLPLIPYGRWGLPLPFRGEEGLHVVIGTPLDLGHQAYPSRAEVQAGLDRFVEAMERLYENHKGGTGVPLEIL